MAKFLLLLAVSFAFFYWFFSKIGVKKRGNKEVVDTIKCERCGVYAARSEAIVKGGRYYCSKECAEMKG
ncbi:MAG: metallothionein [Helicobacteraceae bacterium]|jgi:uncharacterized protein|nr:metallothionein [Helicobacteraceae bacterium]